MDFTREPIIETIITPKEGSKLVVRSSKGGAQEEYFVDSVQVVSFGNAFFFRSLERPKAFLVPVADYEILEVREARMVLKNVGTERTIKIGGGRESGGRAPKEQQSTERERSQPKQPLAPATEAYPGEEVPANGEPKTDKKRDRRRQGRRRRGREERPQEAATAGEAANGAEKRESSAVMSILPPPSQLISETIQQYRGNELFKDIFAKPTEEGMGNGNQEATPFDFPPKSEATEITSVIPPESND